MQFSRTSPVRLSATAVSALFEGEIAYAIRAVRQTEKIGFREAKRAVESYIMRDPVLLRYWEKRRSDARIALRRLVGGT